MRLIIDPLSDGRDDLFLKFDSLPSRLFIGDSYFLSDFFSLKNSSVEQCGLKLLEYWKTKIVSCKKEKTTLILPFGLYDEYVSSFSVKPSKYGVLFTELYTEELAGYSVSIGSFEEKIPHLLKKKRKEVS